MQGASLVKLGSKMRLAQRLLVSQQRMMSNALEQFKDGYSFDGTGVTLRERTAIFQQDMDSLPVPSGDWATEYNKAQTRYHIHLAISSVLFAAVIYYFCTQDYVVTPDLKKPLNLEEVYQARLANTN